MRNFTSGHLSPPKPHPSGGTATDRMFSSSMTRTRSLNPASMSSILALPFQCRFVGKLMITLGFPRVFRWKTNIFPLDFVAAASGFVSFEIVRKRLFELQSDALPHHANCVDGVTTTFAPHRANCQL